MDAHSGRWEQCSADRKMRDCVERPEDSLKLQFPQHLTFTSPRAWAFCVLGMQAYLDWFPGDRAIQGARNTLANRLLDIYERSRSGNWHWFEKSLSYSNARLPQALILAGWHSDNRSMMQAGIESLQWLELSSTARIAMDLCAHWFERILCGGRRKGALRSTASRSVRDDLRLS